MTLLNTIAFLFLLQAQGSQPARTNPPPCGGHELVYHAKLKMVLLINCGEPSKDSGKIWGWNGDRWTLVDSHAPSPRLLGGAAYDSRRDVVVVYGGLASSNGSLAPTSETWEWDGKSWSKIDAQPPSVSDHFAMAYDSAIGKVVITGGQGLDGKLQGGTWTWDGKVWEKVTDEGPGPEAHHALAYNSKSGKLLSLGGHQPEDIWEWDGKTWGRRTEDQPRARSHASLACDDRSNCMLFGGMGNRVWLADTWIMRGNSWIGYRGTSPSPRGVAAIAFDDGRGVFILYGGNETPLGTETRSTERLLSDTWIWDGKEWRQM
jgi:hypothetical protein